MTNKITEKIKIGTLGELLVQIRFLEHDVQAAPPRNDSGNDLIAVKGKSFRAVQVKTTTKANFDRSKLPKSFDILAAVHLVAGEDTIYLDESSIFLIPCDQVKEVSTNFEELEDFMMTRDHVSELFK